MLGWQNCLWPGAGYVDWKSDLTGCHFLLDDCWDDVSRLATGYKDWESDTQAASPLLVGR